MMNNPVVVVRAMMDPATQLSQPRVEGKYQVVDVRLKQGDRLSVGFQNQSDSCQALCKDLPGFIRYTIPTPDLGQDTVTVWLTGYGSFDGIMLPMGFDTHLGFQDIDYQRMTADRYEINGKIEDLAAPPEVVSAPVPPNETTRPVTVEKVADHIWRLAPSGTTAIEFQDHITLFEMDAGNQQAKMVLEAARKLVPGKPVTQLIASHEHFDHVSGLRQMVAEGLAVIAKRANKEQFEEMVNHPAPDYPDDLARNPKPLHFIPVDEKLTLSDPTMTLDILWARNNPHMADAVVAYAPKQKVIMEGDVATASLVWQFWPDSLRDIIDYSVHSIDPQHPGSLTMAQLDVIVKGGVDRARKLCADEAAKNNYLPSCPVYSKRY
jgi:glyoxylase-like metal-dependent hydrolase (beta-lactamase superfamily II)